jgi:DNA modification methylase
MYRLSDEMSKVPEMTQNNNNRVDIGRSTRTTYEIFHGDCRKRLQELPRWSVDCIYTSPNTLLSKSDCFDLLVTINECYRILKESGSIWIEIKDDYNTEGRLTTYSHDFIAMVNQSKWTLRDRIIWHIPPTEGQNKYSFTNSYGKIDAGRFKMDYSFIFRLVKNVEQTYFDRTAVDQECTCSVMSVPLRLVRKGEADSGYPHNVISNCILTSCPEGGTILDPYCGWGSTGVAALESGMSFIGIERDSDMIESLNRRLAEVKMRQIDKEMKQQ